jgi:peptide deformylase
MMEESKVVRINTEEGLVQKKNIEPLQIYDGNSPILKQAIPEYTGGFPNPALIHFSEQLKYTRKYYGGIGLSANQCGFAMRMFVMGAEDFDFVCINPKVLEVTEEVKKDKEGCLSFPGLFANVKRPTWIRVEFFDEHGKRNEITLDGLTARCFLHELDHLNGISIPDRIGKLAYNLAKAKQKKLIRNINKRNLTRG